MSRVRRIITQSSFGGNRCGETFQTQACNLRPCLGKLQIFLLLCLLYLDNANLEEPIYHNILLN